MGKIIFSDVEKVIMINSVCKLLICLRLFIEVLIVVVIGMIKLVVVVLDIKLVIS